MNGKYLQDQLLSELSDAYALVENQGAVLEHVQEAMTMAEAAKKMSNEDVPPNQQAAFEYYKMLSDMYKDVGHKIAKAAEDLSNTTPTIREQLTSAYNNAIQLHEDNKLATPSDEWEQDEHVPLVFPNARSRKQRGGAKKKTRASTKKQGRKKTRKTTKRRSN